VAVQNIQKGNLEESGERILRERVSSRVGSDLRVRAPDALALATLGTPL
jgi:hypothetical protein